MSKPLWLPVCSLDPSGTGFYLAGSACIREGQIQEHVRRFLPKKPPRSARRAVLRNSRDSLGHVLDSLLKTHGVVPGTPKHETDKNASEGDAVRLLMAPVPPTENHIKPHTRAKKCHYLVPKVLQSRYPSWELL